MAKKGMQWYDWVAIVLVLVGALNWGLIGFFGFNLVETLFGTGLFTKIVYDLVGVAAVFGIWGLFKK